MKISISYPPIHFRQRRSASRQNRQFQYFKSPTYIYPVVPAYAATLLNDAGYEVIWDDGIAEEKPYNQWLTDLQHASPDVIMVETKTPVVKKHWAIINEVKKLLPDQRWFWLAITLLLCRWNPWSKAKSTIS